MNLEIREYESKVIKIKYYCNNRAIKFKKVKCEI